MPFDPATIITSAVAGGISGIVFASLKTGQEEKAKRRAAAKDQVHDAVSDVLLGVIAYQAGFMEKETWEKGGWTPGYEWAFSVALAARRLGPIRQRLVKRRVRILLGRFSCDIAYARPSTTGDKHTRADAAAVIRAAQPDKYSPSDLRGLLTRAVRADRNSEAIRDVRRHLTRLAKSW
ncbi:hypothetical protein [Lentzea aerocolonigenes]|uniref:hypothetical protein n=1 Tax=Lentzea aerocolonigenes TaxID=68170 RepID=UPI0004C33391|nr:hypothetical protein [Lentzea aerocolonigenes]MCP2248750.1 hypothetical protein [Lentzea aerocolonigenes]